MKRVVLAVEARAIRVGDVVGEGASPEFFAEWFRVAAVSQSRCGKLVSVHDGFGVWRTYSADSVVRVGRLPL